MKRNGLYAAAAVLVLALCRCYTGPSAVRADEVSGADAYIDAILSNETVEVDKSDKYGKEISVEYTASYRKDGSKSSWSSWQLYLPNKPDDVPGGVYEKLWDLNRRVIKAGKYDYDAYNYGTSKTPVDPDADPLAEDYTFAGVCANYADHYMTLIKNDPELAALVEKGVITAASSSVHAWVEYHTDNNTYILDSTWCDWDFVGEPQGMFANNAQFAESCTASYNAETLQMVKSREWFFRNVKSVKEKFDRWAHGMK